MTRTICLFVFITVIPGGATAQENAGKGLPELIRANEQFGRVLLQKIHSGAPERNVVVSPISLTVLLAALRGQAYRDEAAGEEIDKVFGWQRSLSLSVPARQLLAAFEKPDKPKPCPLNVPVRLPPCFNYVPEGTWITNAFLYRSIRGKNPIDESFVLDASKNFKFKFVNTGQKGPTIEDVRRARTALGSPPDFSTKANPKDDVWISSGTHLQTAWHGNTFSMSEQHNEEFHVASGHAKEVPVLDSEMEIYLHATTSTFEAVVLPCNNGYMIVVLPAPGKDIYQTERELSEQPGVLDATLQRQAGYVTMPIFRIRFESNLIDALQAFGLKGVFKDLGHLVKIPQSHLARIAQEIDIDVSKSGIRADAETVAGAVYGGIMGAQQPFHVDLNRPFLFLIRDETTNALLFVGAVMDPSSN